MRNKLASRRLCFPRSRMRRKVSRILRSAARLGPARFSRPARLNGSFGPWARGKALAGHLWLAQQVAAFFNFTGRPSSCDKSRAPIGASRLDCLARRAFRRRPRPSGGVSSRLSERAHLDESSPRPPLLCRQLRRAAKLRLSRLNKHTPIALPPAPSHPPCHVAQVRQALASSWTIWPCALAVPRRSCVRFFARMRKLRHHDRRPRVWRRSCPCPRSCPCHNLNYFC